MKVKFSKKKGLLGIRRPLGFTPLMKILGKNPGDPVELPPGVSMDEAVEVIKRSDWASHLAEGMCSKLVGLKAGTREFGRCKENISTKVAKGVLT